VVAVDIGSKFAWAAFDTPGHDPIADGTDPEMAVSALAAGLTAAAQAALLLEAPMSVPVPDGLARRRGTAGKGTRRRGKRPWSAGVGAGALATGLARCMDASPAPFNLLTAVVLWAGLRIDPAELRATDDRPGKSNCLRNGGRVRGYQELFAPGLYSIPPRYGSTGQSPRSYVMHRRP
jgi:hypothetical protein